MNNNNKNSKMSDPLPSTSSSLPSSLSRDVEMPNVDELQKKFVNSSTQHGNEDNADEENIVVLATSYSPIREIDEPVQREEFEYSDYLLAKALAEEDDMNVSTKTSIES